MRLLEHFHDAFAALELGFGGVVEVAAELRESCQLAELREIQLDGAGNLLHRFDLRGGSHAAHGEAHRNGGTHTLIKKVSFQKELAVGDGNHVGWNVRGHVARLRFDDGQRGERATTGIVGKARRAFEQAAVQIKHITGICLATRRSLEHQRNLPVRHRVFGQIIENDQRIHVVVHEPLTH